MGSVRRRPFQGITNIIRFNWHFYIGSFFLLVVIYLVSRLVSPPLAFIFWMIVLTGIILILISLLVSYYIYDYSSLYSMEWLKELDIHSGQEVVNIHAGFDETSALLTDKLSGIKLTVLDFYDPAKHTEISIKRARKAFPAFPGTIQINSTGSILYEHSKDLILLILSAHEIRQMEERVCFFKSLSNSLKTNGKIVVVEHQRDFQNFLAYTIGFFHFHSPKTWRQTFKGAGLNIKSRNKLNPFITIYILAP
jgi:hypothetical protein